MCDATVMRSYQFFFLDSACSLSLCQLVGGLDICQLFGVCAPLFRVGPISSCSVCVGTSLTVCVFRWASSVFRMCVVVVCGVC